MASRIRTLITAGVLGGLSAICVLVGLAGLLFAWSSRTDIGATLMFGSATLLLIGCLGGALAALGWTDSRPPASRPPA